MKNADVLDQAQEVTSFMTDTRIGVIRAQNKPEAHPDFDGEHCVEPECGVVIPAERLEMGKVRCVHCAQHIEERNRGPAVKW